ncbi:MAG: hypothetical protein J6Z17_01430 [Treponema sp.]|nr:hypothetical protein [Treponema sp.]
MSVKSFFKKILPATFNKVEEHEWLIMNALKETQHALTARLDQIESDNEKKIEELKKENESIKKRLLDVIEFQTDFSSGLYRRLRELEALIQSEAASLATKEDAARLATSEEVSKLASEDALAELSKKEDKVRAGVSEALAGLASKEDIAALATAEQVASSAEKINAAFEPLATAEQVASAAEKINAAFAPLATAASVAELSEKEEKAHLSTLEAVAKLATAEAVSRLASKEDIAPLATAAQVSKLATAEAVSKLAASDELKALSSLAKETAQKLNLLSAADTINRLASSEEFEQIPSVAKAIKESVKNSGEAVWASIFHDAIQECAWLKNRKFFPGRWAAGYPALYAIYRVLDNFRPKKILELGLGQSTRIIGQYAAYLKDVSHTVVESNPEWIDFFKNDFELSEKTQIKNLEYKMIPFNGKNVRQFDKFNSTFKKEKFDFIFIDAPFGGDMTDFSRIDVARLLPDCLEKNFVIMLDDYDRIAEQNTCAEMEQILIKNKIDFKRGVYSGQKKTVLICSKNLSFLASM